MAKIRIKNVNIDDVMKQIRARGVKISSRKLKDAAHIRGREVEKVINATYKEAVDDLTNILRHKSMLPQGTAMSGQKAIRMAGAPNDSRFYRKHTEHYRKKRQGKATRDVYWYNTGALASFMNHRIRNNRGVKWGEREMTLVHQPSKIAVKFTANVKAPKLYSAKLNEMVNNPFFNPTGRGLTHLLHSTHFNYHTDYISIAYLHEHNQPLFRPVMSAYGKVALARAYRVAGLI